MGLEQNKENKQVIEVIRDPKTGRILPGHTGNPHGRPLGAKNRKTLPSARQLMLDEDYDSVKELIKLSRQTDLDGDLYFKIHQFLSTIQYQDPGKEVEPIDVEMIQPSGMILTNEELDRKLLD